MTDRIISLFVVLDKDYRDDDVEAIINAIQMLRGVAEVKKGEPVDPVDYSNRSMIRRDLIEKLHNVLK